MLKVLIADDEEKICQLIIRNGVKNSGNCF